MSNIAVYDRQRALQAINKNKAIEVAKAAKQAKEDEKLLAIYIKNVKPSIIKFINNELNKKVIGSKDAYYALSSQETEIVISCLKSIDIQYFVSKMKQLNWCKIASDTFIKKTSTIVKRKIVLTLLSKFFMIKNIGNLKLKKELIEKALSQLPITVIFNYDKELQIKTNYKVIKRYSKGILKSNSFTPSDLKFKLKERYNYKTFQTKLFSGVAQYYDYSRFIDSLIKLCTKTRLSVEKTFDCIYCYKDLKILEKNFFPVLSALSTLSANPKFDVMFVDDDEFVVFNRKKPVGRFGKPIGKMLMRDKFKLCQEECGNFYGDKKSILDVLDAEGKKDKEQLKEIFNDLSKHVTTHSCGVAARSALKLKKAIGTNGKINWKIFDEAVSGASKRVRDLGNDPMIDKMKKAVTEIHSGRNVLNLRAMKWKKIFETKDFNWMGRLAADVLEDEVNKNASALEALKNVANWAENRIECRFRLRTFAANQAKVNFVPAKRLVERKWKLELQDIMKSGARWRKA